VVYASRSATRPRASTHCQKNSRLHPHFTWRSL